MNINSGAKESFFTKEKSFYQTMLPMLLVVSLQNIIAYSVNMVDNIMLGSYAQNALAGAATVNQIYFIVNQISLSIGDSLVVLAAQYWGEKQVRPIKQVIKCALFWTVIIGIPMFVVISIFPVQLLSLFTKNQEIIFQGVEYLSIVRWSFLLLMLTNVFVFALRSVGTVKIAFYMAGISLVVNCSINYVLIFGKFGFPQLGIKGAAIGTCISRLLELILVVIYLLFFDQKLGFLPWKKVRNAENNPLLSQQKQAISKNYRKIFLSVLLAQILWAISVPLQTAILGHLSGEAIAANSVATTFYQYLKVIVVAMSSVSAVMIGNSIGKGELKRVRSYARTLQVFDISIGIVLGLALFCLRGTILSFYKLTPETLVLADQLMIIMSVIMVGMSYQMPVSMGLIRGGGDAKFALFMNVISVWFVVMPLSFIAAFYWKLPIPIVVIILQSDQIFKCLPTFYWARSYRWIKVLTKNKQ